MNSGRTRLAAVAIAAAAVLPWRAGADPLADVERSAGAIEAQLASVERSAAAPEEPPADRAARALAAGEAEYVRNDWRLAAVLLSDVLDAPGLVGAPDRQRALFYLADALRRQGECGAARGRYEAYLAEAGAARRAEAISGALECAVKEHRAEGVDALLVEARSEHGAELPADVRYLAAKAIFQRTDLERADRWARAEAAFAEVPPPYALQAEYFRGVLRLEQGDAPGAIARFERCARAAAPDARRLEVQELCDLALGRVHGELGDRGEAIEAYARISRDSPRFTEALYEKAWTYVRAREYDAALRTASLIADLSPESPFAPAATVLQGHLLLRLGRYAAATEAYSRVINGLAPVRDELDAILSMQEDPVRYFNELVGRAGQSFDVAAVLPPVAVKWASTQREVASALGLVGALDRGRRDAEEAAALAARLDATLGRAGGADAFPALRLASALAQAVETAAARALAEAVDAASVATLPTLPPPQRAELARVRSERAALEPRVSTLPRTEAEVVARLDRMRARAGAVERSGFQLELVLDACRAAIAGAQAWVDEHRAEVTADPAGRQEFADELRKHREVIAEYSAALRAIRQDAAIARDRAAGSDAIAEEVRLREDYLARVERQRAVTAAARPLLGARELALLDRADALGGRLRAAATRARAAEERIAASASARAAALRQRVAGDAAALAGTAQALDAVQAEAKALVGAIALRSFAAVRGQFYELVLKADVGLVDVAWARKRVRLDKIQELSIQKGQELQQLENDYAGLLREVD